MKLPSLLVDRIKAGLLRRCEEAGQVMAFAAISLTAIVAIAAFVIDVGSWYQIDRQAQAAADAGATAAANDLPANPSQASTDATTYVNKNISGATTTTVTPYNSSSSKVEVTVQTSAPTYFAKIFGISSVPVTARAVATRAAGGGKWAVFSHNTACGTGIITIPGSSQTIVGGVRSNGALTIPGSNNSLGTTTYGGPNNCTFSSSGSGNTYGGAASPTRDATNYDWPEPWPTSAAEIATYGITCNFSASSYSWGNNVTIPSATYCATTQISIPGSSVTGNVTLIAPKIQLSGSSIHLWPYSSDLLMDHYGNTDFNIAGSTQNFTGTVFVPNARLGISGSSGSLFNVFLEGDHFSISGSNWSLTGTGPSMGYSGSQLIE
jgi:Flp pilus assembly protein TadG